MSAEEISILTVIAHLDETLQMKPLAEKLGRDATTVSRQVANLEQAGGVQRFPSPDDGRASVVTVTKKAAKLVERTIPLTLALRDRAMKGVSRADATVMVKSLSKMLTNLRDDK